ncbi:hypothetical protein MTX78_08770 [Hymenobacter tibetensis]|uniref:DUF4468 domain-containing protein n=1 Tax=Hymenobacter tibetensis TaxID=497967 RepID=A0ABY4D397_9BACT|nr:hypothetical protein [Hymenobacter tibetensis]UOG76682.1 hypothetical protein MTX78_08770 [Hymenobacter tibetensis]
MSTRLLLSATLLSVATTTYAQQTAVPAIEQTGAAAQANINALGRGDAAIVRGASSAGMIGTPYVDNRWLLARITLSSKVPLAPVPLKYDVLHHRLLMRPLNSTADSLQLDDRLVTYFELEEPVAGTTQSRRRVFRRFEEAPVAYQRTDYVEVLHENRYSLLKRYVKVLRKANSAGPYSKGDSYDTLEDKNVYFVRRLDATLVPTKLTLKALQTAAPELATALKQSAAAQAAKTDAEWAAVFASLDPK